MDKATLLDRVHGIFAKILEYQHDQGGGAVALDALAAAGVLSADDWSFLEAHGIEYMPHDLDAHHAGGTLHVPTEEGCTIVSVSTPPPPQHQVRLSEFAPVIEHVLRRAALDSDVSLDIELSENDLVGIAPGLLCFILQQPRWRGRAGSVISVAAEHGLSPVQDDPDSNGRYILSFIPAVEPSALTKVVLDVLRRGFGLTDEDQITHRSSTLEAT